METPNEKAKELVDRMKESITYLGYRKDQEEYAIECAKITVDEIINQIITLKGGDGYLKLVVFWQKVKNELNKM